MTQTVNVTRLNHCNVQSELNWRKLHLTSCPVLHPSSSTFSPCLSPAPLLSQPFFILQRKQPQQANSDKRFFITCQPLCSSIDFQRASGWSFVIITSCCFQVKIKRTPFWLKMWFQHLKHTCMTISVLGDAPLILIRGAFPSTGPSLSYMIHPLFKHFLLYIFKESWLCCRREQG